MEAAAMDLDRSDLTNLASFFARRFPSPAERAQLSGAAGLGWTETAGLEPVAAWTELISLARQRKCMPILAWAAMEARQQDTNLAEVCAVLGAKGPNRAAWWSRPIMRNGLAATFLVSISFLGFWVLQEQRAEQEGPRSDVPALAEVEDVEPPAELVSVSSATAAAAVRPWAENNPLDMSTAPPGLTPVAPLPAGADAVEAAAAKITAPKEEAKAKVAPSVQGFEPISPVSQVAAVEKPVVAAPQLTKVASTAASVATVKSETKAAAPVVAKVAPVVAKTVAPAPKAEPARAAAGAFPIAAPAADPDGRCKVKGGGFVGWWYAGEAKPGRAGETIRINRSANVRASRPDPSNSWNFQSTMRCSVMAGDRVRISGEPVLVNGEAWWVPLQSGDLNPS